MMLGNLSVEQIEKRTGVDFPEEIRVFLKENHQSEAANVKKGKWHCFDIPFTMVCGDIETATKIYESVKDKSSQFKERMQISVASS